MRIEDIEAPKRPNERLYVFMAFAQIKRRHLLLARSSEEALSCVQVAHQEGLLPLRDEEIVQQQIDGRMSVDDLDLMLVSIVDGEDQYFVLEDAADFAEEEDFIEVFVDLTESGWSSLSVRSESASSNRSEEGFLYTFVPETNGCQRGECSEYCVTTTDGLSAVVATYARTMSGALTLLTNAYVRGVFAFSSRDDRLDPDEWAYEIVDPTDAPTASSLGPTRKAWEPSVWLYGPRFPIGVRPEVEEGLRRYLNFPSIYRRKERLLSWSAPSVLVEPVKEERLQEGKHLGYKRNAAQDRKKLSKTMRLQAGFIKARREEDLLSYLLNLAYFQSLDRSAFQSEVLSRLNSNSGLRRVDDVHDPRLARADTVVFVFGEYKQIHERSTSGRAYDMLVRIWNSKPNLIVGPGVSAYDSVERRLSAKCFGVLDVTDLYFVEDIEIWHEVRDAIPVDYWLDGQPNMPISSSECENSRYVERLNRTLVPRNKSLCYEELCAEAKAFVDSPREGERMFASIMGYGVDKLKYDESEKVRLCLAMGGHELEFLATDSSQEVRAAVAWSGFSSESTALDPCERVRAEAARAGQCLDALLRDKSDLVAKEAAVCLVGDAYESSRRAAELLIGEGRLDPRVLSDSKKDRWAATGNPEALPFLVYDDDTEIRMFATIKSFWLES